MKKFLPLFTLIFLLLLPTLTFAHENKNENGNNRSRFELKVENEQDDDENHVRLEIGTQEFEIRGEITEISSNTFVILGQTITIDPSQVSEFKQKGILKVGNIAKVEGVVVGSTKFADEIKVIGTGQGRFKFEIEGLTLPSSSSSPTPSVSPSPSASPEATSSASPSPSPSPEATAAANVSVKIKAQGPIDEVIAFLEQVLSILKNLVF